MNSNSAAVRAGTGAVAGLAATMVLHPLRKATEEKLPQLRPPMREDPGKFMVEQAKRALPENARAKVPQPLEKAAIKSLHLGYGTTFGMLYALARRKQGNVVIDGALLGLVTWATGYLGWLPATKLTTPVTRQKPAQVITPILQHIVFGIAAVSVLAGIRRALAARSG